MKISSFINKYKSEIDEHLVKLLVSSFFDNNINYNYELTKEELEKLESQIKRVIAGEPLQYVIGNVDFYGNIINVDKNVLIPRFETETLVEKTYNYIKKYFKGNIDMLDLCTGSGCIAITLKKLTNGSVDASDISSSALNVAITNAKNNNVEINFIESNILDNIEKKYDVIISNPPYIAYDEKIMDIVKDNEPNIALYAPDNGLFFYKEIIKNCRKNLKDKYIIAFEIGYTQGEYLKEYARKYFEDAKILVEKDLSGKDRYLFIINE